MKNSSQKNFTGKNNKENKKNSDFGYHKKNTNRLEKKERFLNNSVKNKNIENSNKQDKNNTSSSLRRRRPISKSNSEFSNKNLDNHAYLPQWFLVQSRSPHLFQNPDQLFQNL